MEFERISIIGLGLLGGSLAAALKKLPSTPHITGCDSDPATLATAKDMGLIDDATTDIVKSVSDRDLVVICVPVCSFDAILRAIAGKLAPGCIVTDVGSTKADIVAMADEIFASHSGEVGRCCGCSGIGGCSGIFVGSHPIAGSERSGLAAADAELFRGRNCIITPSPHSEEADIARTESFWRDILDMNVGRMTPAEHDRALGRLSHLPHLVAALLMEAQDTQELALAGKGLLDTTRIAAGAEKLWASICMSNSQNLAIEMDKLAESAKRIAAALKNSDAAAIEEFLGQARKRRQRFD